MEMTFKIKSTVARLSRLAVRALQEGVLAFAPTRLPFAPYERRAVSGEVPPSEVFQRSTYGDSVAGKNVLVIGVGALGSQVADWIARLGADISLCDSDIVEAGNLGRCFTFDQIGENKAITTTQAIAKGTVSGSNVAAYPETYESALAKERLDLSSFDFILVLPDSDRTRILATRHAVELGVAVMVAGLELGDEERPPQQGYVASWTPESFGACPACFIESLHGGARVPGREPCAGRPSDPTFVREVAARVAARAAQHLSGERIVNQLEFLQRTGVGFSVEKIDPSIASPECPCAPNVNGLGDHEHGSAQEGFEPGATDVVTDDFGPI